MDSASPTACGVVGQSTLCEQSVVAPMGLRFDTFAKPAEFHGFDGANFPADWTWNAVPSRYRYRRSERRRTTGQVPHA